MARRSNNKRMSPLTAWFVKYNTSFTIFTNYVLVAGSKTGRIMPNRAICSKMSANKMASGFAEAFLLSRWHIGNHGSVLSNPGCYNLDWIAGKTLKVKKAGSP